MSTTILVQQNVYHQRDGHDPVGDVHAFVRHMDDDSPPYVNTHVVIGEHWTELPCGHVTEPSAYSLRAEPHAFTVLPTTEELTDARRNGVIVISTSGEGYGDYELHLSESAFYTVQPGRRLFAKTTKGQVVCSVIVVPR